jgi:hypothetical protein
MFPPPTGDETDGEIGVVEALDRSTDEEPRDNGLKVVKSIELIETDLGEGMADPVEAYRGRNSSALCAKKHTFLEQPDSSLQSRVLYWAGCSQDSKTP